MAKILIVDDDKGIRNTLREILQFEKYKVECHHHGYQDA